MPSLDESSQFAYAEGDEEHKQLNNREIRDMVSAITHGIADFHKPGGSAHRRHHLENEEQHGLSMISLVGRNNGATMMRSEIDEKSSSSFISSDDEADDEALKTYVNSNFQAINNSIMLGGSYQANDPGVHMNISDFFCEPQSQSHHKAEKHDKKGKKKEKEASKPQYHSSHSAVTIIKHWTTVIE